jgi:hypothetical protein
MTLDFFAAVLSADFRIRQAPEHDIDYHEDGLGEDPRHVYALGLDLFPGHVDVVLAGVVA